MANQTNLMKLTDNARADRLSWLYAYLYTHAKLETLSDLSEDDQVASRKRHAIHTKIRQLAEIRLKGYDEIAKTLNSSGSPDGNIDLIFTTCDKMEDLWKKGSR